MRDYNGIVTFDPRLPESWAGLTFQITLRGTRVKVEVTSREIAFTVVEGESAELAVRGDCFTVSAQGTSSLRPDGPRSRARPIRCT